MRPKPSRVSAFKNCFGTIWSVSTLTRSMGATRPVCLEKGFISHPRLDPNSLRSRGFIAARWVMPVALHAANKAVNRGTEAFHALDHALHGRLQQHEPVGQLTDGFAILLDDPLHTANILLKAVEIHFHAVQEVALDHLVVA